MSRQQTRRDRRIAKQSNWTRPGRSNPKLVGHGGGGMKTAQSKLLKIIPKEIPSEQKPEPLKFNLVIKINTID